MAIAVGDMGRWLMCMMGFATLAFIAQASWIGSAQGPTPRPPPARLRLPDQRLPEVATLQRRSEDLRWPQSDQQAMGQCNFDPTEDEVRQFLQSALTIPYHEAKKTPPSDCQIEGSLVFVGGAKADWMIDNHGIGILILENGEVIYIRSAVIQAKEPTKSEQESLP